MYSCNLCTKSYVWQHGLQKHVRVKYQNSQPQPQTQPQPQPPPVVQVIIVLPVGQFVKQVDTTTEKKRKRNPEPWIPKKKNL